MLSGTPQSNFFFSTTFVNCLLILIIHYIYSYIDQPRRDLRCLPCGSLRPSVKLRPDHHHWLRPSSAPEKLLPSHPTGGLNSMLLSHEDAAAALKIAGLSRPCLYFVLSRYILWLNYQVVLPRWPLSGLYSASRPTGVKTSRRRDEEMLSAPSPNVQHGYRYAS